MALSVEVKRKWVEALRSGKFKQGKGQLYITKDNSYCCLGVFCKINDLPYKYPQLTKYGISTDIQNDLFDLNDNRSNDKGEEIGSKSFEFIADYIEEKL